MCLTQRSQPAAGPHQLEANAPLGTLHLRRTFTNNTGLPVSRLRFRVIDITTRARVRALARISESFLLRTALQCCRMEQWFRFVGSVLKQVRPVRLRPKGVATTRVHPLTL